VRPRWQCAPVTLIRHVRHAEGPEPAEYSRVSQDKRGELANTLVRLLVAALKARGNAAPMRALAIIACVVGAIAPLGLAFTDARGSIHRRLS
jgi:hypothetical protein